MTAVSTQSNAIRVIVCASTAESGEELRVACVRAGFRVVGRVAAQRAVVEVALSVACDLVLLEVSRWSITDVLSACEDLSIAAAVPVLLVSDVAHAHLAGLGKPAGVEGVLITPVSQAQLVASAELATADPGDRGARSGAFAIRVPNAPGPDLGRLSAREQEVFGLLARGRRTNEIGKALFISPHTVRKHAKVVFRKLGVHSQVELMRVHYERMRARQ